VARNAALKGFEALHPHRPAPAGAAAGRIVGTTRCRGAGCRVECRRDTPLPLSAKLSIDDSGAGGARVDVEFDAPLIKEFREPSSIDRATFCAANTCPIL
jgi:hypothetical protein